MLQDAASRTEEQLGKARAEIDQMLAGVRQTLQERLKRSRRTSRKRYWGGASDVARVKARTSRQAWLILLVSILFFAGLTGTVMATPAGDESAHGSGSAVAGHGEGAAAESHGDAHHDEGAMLDLLARFINFALLVIILAVVLKKSNALGFFSDRVTEIKNRMEQLQREKEEAEAKYKEVQRKLTDFEAERRRFSMRPARMGKRKKTKSWRRPKNGWSRCWDRSS